MEQPTGTETFEDEDLQNSEQERPIDSTTTTIHEDAEPEVGLGTEADHNLDLADLELQKLEQERLTDSTTAMVHEDA